MDVVRVNHDLGMIGDVSIQRLCAPQTTQVHSAGRAITGVGEVIGTQLSSVNYFFGPEF